VSTLGSAVAVRNSSVSSVIGNDEYYFKNSKDKEERHEKKDAPEEWGQPGTVKQQGIQASSLRSLALRHILLPQSLQQKVL